MPARRDKAGSAVVATLAALSDENRLRLLRLLEREELSVGELARIVQLPQSSVSRHLKALLEAGLLFKRARGTSSMYRVRSGDLAPVSAAIWTAAREDLERARAFEGDASRLADVLASRSMDSRDFFGGLGGDWDRLRRELFGSSFTAASLLSLLDPRWIVADIGCGTGEVAELLAPVVGRVIAIDREPSMLDAARKRLARFRSVQFREGDALRLPLEDGEVDAAVASLVMHHIDDPAAAVAEIARTLRAGAGTGALLIIDMMAHDREDFRHTMGHRHLGFAERDIKAWARRAGLRDARYLRLAPDPAAKGPGLFAATMRKAASTPR